MQHPRIAWLLIGIGMVFQGSAAPAAAPLWPQSRAATAASVSASSGAAALKQDMRKLWTDHVVWTRNYIIAAVGDQPDAQSAAGRLMKKQEDALADGIVKQFPDK